MKINSGFYNKQDKEYLQQLTELKVKKELLTRAINKHKWDTRIWTKEEYEFLINNWGKLSVIEIAKALNRSKLSVNSKVARIGLKNWFIYSDYITLNQLYKMIYNRSIDSYEPGVWQRYKMPYKDIIKKDKYTTRCNTFHF